jgi:hypothetical protein
MGIRTMNNEEELTPETSEEQPDKPMSELSRIGGVFMEPSRTMVDVAQRPTWLLAFILGILFVTIPIAIHPTRVDQEALIKAQTKQAMRFTGGADPKQIEAAIRARSGGWWAKYGTLIMIPIGGLVVTLAIAGIMLLAFMLAGAQVCFKKSLAAFCWTGLPTSFVLSALAVIFLYAKPQEDLNPLDPMSNVLSNLSFLVNQDAQPVLSSLLGSIDIFSFWRIYLLGLAFAAASMGKSSVKKAIGVVVVLWILYIMLKLAFTGIFS